jgi:hypothetical protein
MLAECCAMISKCKEPDAGFLVLQWKWNGFIAIGMQGLLTSELHTEFKWILSPMQIMIDYRTATLV